jgi:NodT family efflux transporter outer membrane factor (OMF) lipoprotein
MMKSPHILAISLIIGTSLLGNVPIANAASQTVASDNPIRGQAVWQEELQGQPVDGNTEKAALQFVPNFPDKSWWLQFGDSYLTGYINQALKANQDVEIASLKVAEAQALVRQSLAREFPKVSLAPNFVRQHNSNNMINFDPSSQGMNAPMSPTIIAPGSTFNLFTVPLQASYEVDLWGKNHARTKSKRKQQEAIVQQQKAVLLAVTTEVASAYLNLLRADELIRLTQGLIEKQQDLVDIRQSQWTQGLVSKESLLAAEENLETNKAFLNDLQKQQSLFAHQLSILTGQPPKAEAHLERGRLAQFKLPAEIPSGAPAKLVERRPDVLAQEAQLQSSRIEVALARKAYLPDLRLTGQFGFGSLKLSNLLSWDSMLASVGGSLVQTIFDAGEQKAQYKLMQSRNKQEVQRYQQTVLKSFFEVENSLASLRSDQQALGHMDRLVAINTEAVELMQSKGNAGILPQMDVLEAQTKALSVEQKAAQTKTDTLIDLISLYKALGGGF